MKVLSPSSLRALWWCAVAQHRRAAMRADSADPGARQSRAFLLLYALAVSGGSVAYVPFLTIILPMQAARIAGADAEALNLLAYAAFAGAIAASVANIGFGWLSDRSRTRRPWIAAGMLLSSAILAAMPLARNGFELIAMIIGWQICLNMMLAPLMAWAGDCVPDWQKGLLGGLLAFAPALGALAGALVTIEGVAGADDRLLIVALLVVVMVSPALVAARPVPTPWLMQAELDSSNTAGGGGQTSAVRRMWLARLFVQISEASLFAFLLLWFRSVEPGFPENQVATIFAAVLSAAVILTLLVGRWSDREDRPIMPLGVCAALGALGLLMMALAPGLFLAISGYVLFGLASSVFLALHSSQTLRVLKSPQTRGRSLGLFNLTNTVPSLVMPWLTLALVPLYGFDALFMLLAGLAMGASILLMSIARAQVAVRSSG
jgi:MFS family permease